jgi:hypothetical protein
VSTLHRFAEADLKVSVPRKAFEAAVPAIFRDKSILDAAGVKMSKDKIVAPLSAWRFLRDDPDAIAFAEKVGVDPRTKSCTVRNTGALKTATLPWVGQGRQTGKVGFSSIYAAEDRIADPLTLRMVKPVKRA